MKKMYMGVVAVGAVFLLSGCSSDKSETQKETTVEVASESETYNSFSAESETEEESSGVTKEDIRPKEINQSFVDEEQGFSVTVQEMVTNIPAKKSGENDKGQHFGVGVKLSISSTEKKLLNAYRSQFQLQVGNETINESTHYYSYFSDYTEEQGWKQLDNNVKNGETKEGWIIFFLDQIDKDKPMAFKCKRPEIPVTVIGGDNYTIPAEEFKIEL